MQLHHGHGGVQMSSPVIGCLKHTGTHSERFVDVDAAAMPAVAIATTRTTMDEIQGRGLNDMAASLLLAPHRD